MSCKICGKILSFGLCIPCSLPTAEQEKQRDEENKKVIAEFQEAMDERVEPPTPKRWKHLKRVK